MEALFAYRQMVGFRGEYSEPEIGRIGEASQGLLRLGKQLEQDVDQPLLPAPLGSVDKAGTWSKVELR